MELEALTDEQLMTRYQEGEVRAFEVLLARHGGPVYNFVLRHTGDAGTAEDLLQEVFLRLVKSAGSYRRQARFKTWLYTIARNLCVDTLRKRRHRRALSLDQPLGDNPDGRTLLETIPDTAPLEDRRVGDQQFSRELRRALDGLNPDQREVFVLREFQNLKFAEIAEITGCSVNTVKSRMRYALEALRESLAAFRNGEDRTALAGQE